MLTKLKTGFKAMKPETQQRLTIAVIVSVVVLIAVALHFFAPNEKNPVNISAGPSKSALNIDNKILEKTVTAKTDDQDKKIDELQKKLAALQSGTTSNLQQPAMNQQGAPVIAGTGNPSLVSNGLPNQVNLGNGQVQQPQGPKPAAAKARRVASSLPPIPAPPNDSATSSRHSGHASYPDPPSETTVVKAEMIGGIGRAHNGKSDSEGKSKSTNAAGGDHKKKEKQTVYLPPSFMKATLLSGLVASTVDSGKNDPIPAIIRVSAPAQLPNEVKASLQGCFVIAEGTAALDMEKVKLRLVSLSCIAKNGQSVIDEKITGFVEDSNGEVGLSGRVVAKFGSNVARSFLAGLFSGIGGAASQSASTVSISPLGQTSTVGNTVKDLAIAGFGGGLTQASRDVERFYLELARMGMPVIEVKPGRHVTLVITKGANLEIKSYKTVPWY